MADKDDKTEAPTSKRKSETRNKGQVAKSQDLNSGFMLLVATLSLWICGGWLVDDLKEGLVFHLSSLSTFILTDANLLSLLRFVAIDMLKAIAPFLILALFFGILINLVQVGFLFTLEPLQPKFGKIFKMQGLAKFKSLQPWVELAKGLAKIVIIGWVVWEILEKHYESFLLLLDQNVWHMWETVLIVGFEISIKVAILLLVLGIVDFVYQKYKFNKDQKMSKQEVKDEAKQSEGDQAVKNRMKQLGFEMVRKSMMSEVPKATVVITNPTFIAIAIRYDRLAVGSAPEVVAKGKRLIAENIRNLAQEHNIPIVENKPVARGMYDLVEVGDEIPTEFFSAVAEVLAYVYKMDSP